VSSSTLNQHHRRLVTRAAAVLAGTTAAVLAASPAMALMRDPGDEPGTGLSVLETLGYFVGIPLGIVALITFCVFIPEIVAGASVRSGLVTPSEPLWINGPAGVRGQSAQSEAAIGEPAASGAGQPHAGVDGAPKGGTSAWW
jgi:hypothetical protein